MKYGKIRNFFENSPIEIKIAVILFFVLTVAAIVLAVVFMNRGGELQYVDITNFSDITDAPDAYKKRMQELIGMLIGKNENIPDGILYGAVIRDGSYSEDIEKNMTTAHFLVDIEELRYSFEVTISWPKVQSNSDDLYVKIQCPYYTDVIYPDTQCIAESLAAQVERYLPHNYVLGNGHKVHVDKSNFGGEFQLLVYIDACKNQKIIDEAMSYTEEWLRSVYLDPSNYKIESYDTCMTSFKEEDTVRLLGGYFVRGIDYARLVAGGEYVAV